MLCFKCLCIRPRTCENSLEKRKLKCFIRKKILSETVFSGLITSQNSFSFCFCEFVISNVSIALRNLFIRPSLCVCAHECDWTIFWPVDSVSLLWKYLLYRDLEMFCSLQDFINQNSIPYIQYKPSSWACIFWSLYRN